MNTWIFIIRTMICLFLATVLTEGHKNICEKKLHERVEGDYRFSIFRYPPLCILFFPVLILTAFLVNRTALGTTAVAFVMFSGILLEIMIVFSILTLIMPLLRRKLLASNCANLWFIPCGMFTVSIIYYYQLTRWDPSSHWANIVIPGHILRIILVIWFAGFVLLMGHSILSHLWYRKYLLQNAYPVSETVKAQWLYVRRSMACKTEYPLMFAPHATSPISIGMFKTTVCVLLPKKDYTYDELNLILRHELIHVLREDGQLKFLLTFARSLFWFNPLVWKATRMSAEDTELACDELVLADYPSEIRQQYASLVLGSAGEARGFSSCLSAKASSLRYRLHEVVNITEKKPGYGYIWILLFAIFMLYGRINITCTPLGSETIFGATVQTIPTASQLTKLYFDRYKEDCLVTGDFERDSSGDSSEYDPSLEELYSYICSLRYCVTTSDNDPDSEGRLNLDFRDDSYSYRLSVEDHYIYYRVVELTSELKEDSDIWYIADTVDWDYIESLIPNKSTHEGISRD